MTLKGLMIADPRYLCGSWAYVSLSQRDRTAGWVSFGQ